jgi:PKD repeat protein
MYGNSSLGTIFTLMSLDDKYQKSFVADWSFMIVNPSERMVAFRDQSRGEIFSWHWDFGDGTTSDQQNPVHRYRQAGKYIVVLTIEGPDGTSRLANVWDVAVE